VEVAKAAALGSKLFNMGGSIRRGTERLEVGPAGIIEKDDDKIRRLTGTLRPAYFGQSYRRN